MRDIGHHGAAGQAVTPHQFRGDKVGDLAGNTAQIEGEQHAAVAGGIADGEGFDPEFLRGAFGGMVAGRIAGHPQRVGRRDFFAAGAGLPSGGRGGSGVHGVAGGKTERDEEREDRPGAEGGEGGKHGLTCNRRVTCAATRFADEFLSSPGWT